MPPEVSVVMPVRNGAATLDLAIQSIVQQSFEDWELLVVDDGSTDGAVARMQAWATRDDRLRVQVDGRAVGISQRLNQGVASARGSLIARMDGDDISYPGRLAKQVAYLRTHPDVDVVAARMLVFASDGLVRGQRPASGGEHAAVTANVLRGIPLPHPTWMGRREWFLRNRYDPRAGGCEDQELLLRAMATSRYASLPDVLLGYREDRLKLRRSLVPRLHQGAFLLRYGARNQLLVPSAVAAVNQLARGVRDILAVVTRQQDLVLRRRSQAASTAEVAAWTELWSNLTSS